MLKSDLKHILNDEGDPEDENEYSNNSDEEEEEEW